MSTTFQSIKQTAFTLFAEKGYEATTLNEIATNVGIKKPSLYVYFASKQELFLTLLDELLREYRSAVQQMIEEAERQELRHQLQHLFKSYILWFIEEQTKSQFWSRALLFPPVDIKNEIFQRIFNVESQFLEKEKDIIERLIISSTIRAGKKDDIILSIRSLRSGLLSAYLITPSMEQQKIDAIWERFWIGIRKEQAK